MIPEKEEREKIKQVDGKTGLSSGHHNGLRTLKFLGIIYIYAGVIYAYIF